MPSWIGTAARRGILTSTYPTDPASPEEVPETARPPLPQPGAVPTTAAVEACPTRAIDPTGVDQGRCIRCARCLAHGLSFRGSTESSRTLRSALHEPTTGPAGASPLRELGRSLHIFLVDIGSCNACNLEVLALANPYYDLTREGLFFTNSPRHADVLLVVGVPTPEMIDPLRRAYEALPAPKAVVAVGACPTSGGIFAEAPDLTPELSRILPVDLYIPGCPPTPLAVLDGLLTLQGRARTEAVG